MKTNDFVEKREFKRFNLSLPMSIRCASSSGKEATQQGVTGNVSFTGAYVTDINLKNIKPDDDVHMSLSVPRDDARDFPFSRIVGKARIVRIDKDGAALKFEEDVSRLFIAA